MKLLVVAVAAGLVMAGGVLLLAPVAILAATVASPSGEVGEASGALAADGTAGGPGPVGDVACPIGRPHHFTDTWGAPRSGGRTHKGVDIFADTGVPLYAYRAGTVRLTSSRLGGISLWITSEGGDRYYYAHLAGYAPGVRTGSRVEAGDLVGFNGNTGNARATPPHLHWEVHPGGGPAVNPTPYAAAACRGATP
ncbi:MAG: peptidoglycan DD-metalloendopeptidase family protein [Micromonosporaceae bacterium]|nr:peptidoglycan DD-metalloendopeptidase family protein [Micromonosporaceae bacterium]